MMLGLLLAVGVAYLLGSIPTGLWFGRRATGTDIRLHGSGRTGATNVLRTFGWRAGFFVFAVDIAKGIVAVLLGRVIAFGFGFDPAIVPVLDSLAAFAAIFGHNFPVFAGFRGGRGVATGFGTLIAINPLVALVAIVGGVALMLGSDTVSLGSVVGAAFAVVLLWFLGDHAYMPYAVLSAALVIAQHRDNLARLRAGNERRLGVRDKLLDRLHLHRL